MQVITFYNQTEKLQLNSGIGIEMIQIYVIYFQLEKSRKIPGEKLEKRKLFRNTYDSTGPNDERYYVSNSSGFGKSNKLSGLLLLVTSFWYFFYDDNKMIFVKLCSNIVSFVYRNRCKQGRNRLFW